MSPKKLENLEFLHTLLCCRILVNVTVSWYHTVLHKKKKKSGSRSPWKTGKLKVLKKIMIREFYTVCNVLLSIISFPLTYTSCWTAPSSFQCTLCCCFLCHLGFERIFGVWQADRRGYSWELTQESGLFERRVSYEL